MEGTSSTEASQKRESLQGRRSRPSLSRQSCVLGQAEALTPSLILPHLPVLAPAPPAAAACPGLGVRVTFVAQRKGTLCSQQKTSSWPVWP
jgi:hypothetical protein